MEHSYYQTGYCDYKYSEYLNFFLLLGGIVCIVARMESLTNLEEYKDTFFPLCDQLEKEGRWQKIDSSSCPYWQKVEGAQVLYKVC